MRTGFDQLAKRIGHEALGPCGRTVLHDEIHPDAQHADLRHEPDPSREAERARLGLLGRMAAVPCLIEVYAHTLGAEELRACLVKHITFWQQRTRAARKARKQRRTAGASKPMVEPFLWIISAGAPSALLRSLEAKPAPGWPTGVYMLSDVLRVGIVAASELPRDRSTLLVRLMAAGPLLAEASAELGALPSDAHERTVASQILLSLQRSLRRKTRPTHEEQEFIATMHDAFRVLEDRSWKKGHREGRQEGRQEGELLGGQRSLHRVLAARGLVPTAEEAQRIEACDTFSTIERWIGQAMTAQTVAEALREAGTASTTRAARRPAPARAPRRRKSSSSV